MADTALDDFANLLEELGLSDANKPETNEERFLAHFISGLNPQIFLLYHDLIHQMARYDFMKEDKIQIAKYGMKSGVAGVYELTRIEYARLQIEYYLLACHLRYFVFQGIVGFERERIADIKKSIDLVMALDETVAVIQSGKFPQTKEIVRKCA